jgi:hypothetical protein
MRHLLFLVLAVSIFAFKGTANAESIFGRSTDAGNYMGYVYIQDWLNANGYSAIEAKTDYTRGGNDKFYWDKDEMTFNIALENAGYADENVLGAYFRKDGEIKTRQIFSGTDGVGDSRTMNLRDFGLYLTTPQGNTWYTYRFWNEDEAAQALIYTLEDGKKWLVCWEDKAYNACGTDRDFNDMMVTVTATPEPLSAGLFILGGGVLAVLRRKNSPRNARS